VLGSGRILDVAHRELPIIEPEKEAVLEAADCEVFEGPSLERMEISDFLQCCRMKGLMSNSAVVRLALLGIGVAFLIFVLEEKYQGAQRLELSQALSIKAVNLRGCPKSC